MTEPNVKTAFHEAGHAVAVFLQGGDLTYVTAIPDFKRWSGLCTWKHSESMCLGCSPIHEAVATLAGPAVEQSLPDRHLEYLTERTQHKAAKPQAAPADAPMLDGHLERVREKHDRRGGTPSDEEAAWATVIEHAQSTEEAAALLHWLRLRAKALVASAKFQALLHHLAEVLLNRGHIDGRLATLELQRAELRFDDASALAGRTAETSWEAP